MRQLFRQQAVDAQRQKLLGELSVANPVPFWVYTVLAAACAVTLIAFAFWGEYTRRERVEGFLALDAGAARVLAPEGGVITELLVKEGDTVRAGAPLMHISLERSTATGESSGDLVQRELKDRIAVLSSEQAQAQRLAEQQMRAIRQRIADLHKEIQQLDAEIHLQLARVASAREELGRTSQLVKEKFISDSALTDKRNELLDQQSKLAALRRSRLTVERDLGAARTELPTIEMQAQQKTDQLSRLKSELQQDIVQEQARQEAIVRAPVAGTVTNIAASQGESIAANASLAMVLPAGSGLHAQLWVPTRAIGFVKPGNTVMLRYDAFPFQRFGQHRGEVATVGQTVWSPGEKIGAYTVREPVYRIDVRLARQTIEAGGQQFVLRPGMLINADLLMEKRTIFEWVFEPVLELRARLKQDD